MHFSIEHSDNIVIFTLKQPNLDSNISAQLKAELLISCQPDRDAFIFDLTNVEYVDSTGLGSLLLAHRQLRDHDVPIILVGVSDVVMKLLNLSRINGLFQYYDTVPEALEGINSERS